MASEHEAKGRAWARKVIAEKLASGDLPNLGSGYSDELRAARAVQSIADRKLYTRSGRSGQKLENSMSRKDRDFWRGALAEAGEYAVRADTLVEDDEQKGARDMAKKYTWEEQDDGSWRGYYDGYLRVAKVRYAEAGEAEGGLGALARHMAAAHGLSQPELSPAGWYWVAARKGVWSRPQISTSLAAAKKAAEKYVDGDETKRKTKRNPGTKRIMNPHAY